MEEGLHGIVDIANLEILVISDSVTTDHLGGEEEETRMSSADPDTGPMNTVAIFQDTGPMVLWVLLVLWMVPVECPGGEEPCRTMNPGMLRQDACHSVIMIILRHHGNLMGLHLRRGKGVAQDPTGIMQTRYRDGSTVKAVLGRTTLSQEQEDQRISLRHGSEVKETESEDLEAETVMVMEDQADRGWMAVQWVEVRWVEARWVEALLHGKLCQGL
mmetsp:Transcript_24913/g.41039  ORF Transcript_24913/g.41039 Transcript_24913/m.41039 type:complete len:216 (-) Transcript_24913:644-1291(-)